MAVFNLKLLIVKVGKLDVCGRSLFANPVMNDVRYMNEIILMQFFTRRVINPWNNLPKEVINEITTEDLILIDHYNINNMYICD